MIMKLVSFGLQLTVMFNIPLTVGWDILLLISCNLCYGPWWLNDHIHILIIFVRQQQGDRVADAEHLAISNKMCKLWQWEYTSYQFVHKNVIRGCCIYKHIKNVKGRVIEQQLSLLLYTGTQKLQNIGHYESKEVPLHGGTKRCQMLTDFKHFSSLDSAVNW